MAEVVVAVEVADAEAVVAEANKVDWASLPVLGVGLGFREKYHADVFRYQKEIDFLEIVADHFYLPDPYKAKQLELLKTNFRLVPHGLALSLGSAEGLDSDYTERFLRIVDSVSPPWFSEHIAFTRAAGIDIGHLTPLPRTQESLDVLVRNIEALKSCVHARFSSNASVPLILENITETLRFPGVQMDEASYLGELLHRSNCGLLLDITNLYINSVNYRFDPVAFLHKLPADRIVQLHYVGGHWEDGLLVDSHSSSTPEEVWQLMEEVCKYAPVKGILLERDEKLPPIEELVEELRRARGILACSRSR